MSEPEFETKTDLAAAIAGGTGPATTDGEF